MFVVKHHTLNVAHSLVQVSELQFSLSGVHNTLSILENTIWPHLTNAAQSNAFRSHPGEYLSLFDVTS